MLTTLFLAAAVTALPPLPTDYVPPKQPVLSPKQMELKASLGTPMLKTVPQAVTFNVSPGTNFLTSSVQSGNQVIVSWTNGPPPFQVWSSQSLPGPWGKVGSPTMLTGKTCPMSDMGFIRVQGNVPLLSITHTNPTTLTWVAPEIDMSDSLSPFHIYDRTTAPPAGQAPNDITGWTEIPGSPTTALTIDDTNALPRWYKPVQVTANGVVVPYDVKSASGAPAWPKKLGGTSQDSGTAVTTDASGNIILAGYFSGTVDFGNGPKSSAGSWDLFIVKYSPSGGFLWSKTYGGTATEQIRCIALDASGNIFLAGTFLGTANFGGANRSSAGNFDAFLAKYSPTGDYLWDIPFGDWDSDRVNGMAVDSQGNVIITGTYNGTIPMFNPSPTAGPDCFVAKFSPGSLGVPGTLIWGKDIANGGGSEEGTSIAIDSADNIFVGGYFQGYVNFGGGIVPSGAGWAGFLAKLSSSGDHIWSRPVAGDSAQTHWLQLSKAVINSSGDVIVAGIFGRSANLGLGTIHHTPPGDVIDSGGAISGAALTSDLFVAKYSGATGLFAWGIAIGGDNSADMNGLAVDSQNNIFIAGDFQGSRTFGNQTLTTANLGASDGFLARLTSSGVVQWSTALSSGSSNAALNGVAVDFSGNPVTTGSFVGTGTFNGRSLASSGSSDVLLAKLNPDGSW